ncbi:MAG TPA: type II toxin-antitoxin system Phd/YefM family antitoxin [Candidatus Kaiserbacteria bacterium]|nr:type II toxin-antitoxin system Phd/YefM family antitoxin [Candidatus Kaiserbacteria bacterium]
MTTKFIGIKEFRQNMAKIANRVRKNNEKLIVLRKNKPVFELRPLSDEEVFKESFIRDVEEAKEQVKKKEVYSQEEILKEFGL